MTKSRIHECTQGDRLKDIESNLSKNNELTNLKMDNLTKKVDELKSNIDKFIESADNKYSSKQEYLQNKERIDKIDDNFKWIIRLIIGVIILAVLSVVIIKVK